MNDKQLDQWTILMAGDIDPLTAWAATDQDDDDPPPPPQKKYPAWIAVVTGVIVGYLLAMAVS